MSQQRKFKGVWIPAEIWLDHSLSITEKVMLVEIDSLQDDHRGCYASNSHFAEFFGLSISRVSEIISGLADRKLITVELVRDGKRIVERRIRLIGDPFEKPNTPSGNAANPFGKDGEPPSENTQGSNTKERNTRKKKDIGGSPEFEQAWSLYPPRAGGNSKPDALKAWNARIAAGVESARMLDGTQRYAAFCKATNKINTEYVKQAATFFGPGLHFDAAWMLPVVDSPRMGGRPSSNSFDQSQPADYDDFFNHRRGFD
ncbi:putative DNA replication protein [Burkholderia phage Bcep22]|uniref:DNA replication protein n=1 Tax=Burkholderia phage Bcep22 TaxID=2883944 RepID=Q6V7R6_9CAUD|nr:replication initiation protein [Burkholderia phage Bcep22]AAQ54960.1 putative DNA replication protein [Burkholderia phage Bcep22]